MDAATAPTTFDRVLSVLENRLGVDPKDVKPEAKIQEDLGIDSLERVDLAIEMEDAFNIRISDDDLDGIVTVQDLINTIDRLLR